MIVRGFNIKPFADLRGADLSGADIRYANLRCADIRYANLRCADLGRADLSDADLSDADLSGADLSGAVLCGADLTGSALTGADLRYAWIRETKFTADQLMWLTLTGQITPDQAAECKVLITKDKQMVDTDQTGCYTS